MLTILSIAAVQLVILIQDFRTRSIHWFTIPALIVLFLCANALNIIDVSATDILLNISFVLTQLIGLTLYFSFKHRSWVLPFDRFIGWGDILYLFAMSFAFSSFWFVLFVITSLLFSLLTFGVFMLVKKTDGANIPLAALMALWLFISYACFHFYPASSQLTEQILCLWMP
jgi:hypothetical protein